MPARRTTPAARRGRAATPSTNGTSTTPRPPRVRDTTRPEPWSKWETVTPQIADEWLQLKNPKNRPINERLVGAYARLMAEGHWEERNGEVMSFDWDCLLVSGQHRLLALIQANVTLNFLVVYGVDPKSRHTVDKAFRRTLGHDFAIEKVASSNQVASAVNWYWKYLRSEDLGVEHPKPSSPEVLDLYNGDPAGWDDAYRAAARAKKLITTSLGCFAVYVTRHKTGAEVADTFLEQLISGSDLKDGSPALALRERYFNMKRERGQREAYEVLGLYFKAFMAYRQGRQMKLAHFRDTEVFPRLS